MKNKKKAPRPTNVVSEASSSSLNPPVMAGAAAALKCRFLKLSGDVIESVEVPMKKVLDGAKVQDVGAALAAKLSDPYSPVRQRLWGFADRTVVWPHNEEQECAWLLMRVAMDKLIEIDGDDDDDESTFKFIEFHISSDAPLYDFEFTCEVVDYGPWIAELLGVQAEDAGRPHDFMLPPWEDWPPEELQRALATLAPTDVEDLRRCLEVFGETEPRRASKQRMRDIVEMIEEQVEDPMQSDRIGIRTDIKLTAIGTTVRNASISELQNGDDEVRTLLVETPKDGTTKIVFADEKRADIVRLACQVLQWLPAAMRCESDSVPAGAYEVYSETFSLELKWDVRNHMALDAEFAGIWKLADPEVPGDEVDVDETPKILAMGGRFLRAVYVPTYLSPLIDDMETEHRYMRRHTLKFICLDQAPAADVEPLEGSVSLSKLLPFVDATSGSPVLDLHVMGPV